MPKEKKILIILDMHAILHRSFHALPSFSSGKGEPTGALYGFVTFLLKAIRELKPNYIAAAYDLPEPTFRHAAYDKYKGQRPELASDLAGQISRSYDVLKTFGIPFFEHKKFEADDIIGTLVEKTKEMRDIEVIIASGDMDTLQLTEGDRVKVFTLKKGINDTIIYDEKKVIERFGFGPKLLADYKGIRGDPSDNIPGVPGIGEKGASEMILKYGSLEKIYKAIKKDRQSVIKSGVKERIVKLLEEHEEEALFSRELGSIRRDVPIEFDLKKMEWGAAYDKVKVDELFKDLGFFSLLSRLPSFAEVSVIPTSEISTQDSPDILEKSQKIFWHLEGEKLYAVLEDRKVWELNINNPLVGKLLGSDKRHYFFDSKKIFHKLDVKEIPQITFDLRIGAWLSRNQLQNPEIETVIHSFLPKVMIGDGETLKAVQLLPELSGVVERELDEKKIRSVWEDIELPLIPVLFEMEREGILIDAKFLSALSKKYEKELVSIQNKIWKMCGGEFNISSPKQLGEVLFGKLKLTVKGLKKTGTGAMSTRESELLKLKNAHPVIAEILSYRELSKLKSTYLDTLPLLLDKSSRVHTTYDQTGAVTGRLSSHDPNLQNIPIRSEAGREIRKGFLARSGFEIVAFDYSQLELRIAAILSGDEKMIKAFKDEKDIHAITAAEIFNVPESEVTDSMRRKAKVINFGILYGMGINALTQALEVTRAQAQQFWEEYFEDFSGVYEYLEKTKEGARKNGYVETIFGRRRYLPEIYSQVEWIRKEAERMATNAPIQGTEADIVKLGMIRSRDFIKKNFLGRAFQLLQIHDELLFEVEKKATKEFIGGVKNILEGIYQGEVVLKVETKVGPTWGEMKKYGNIK